MPELPEIASRAQEIKKELSGKIITSVEVLQPKCLNILQSKFVNSLSGAQILNSFHRGKWIFIETSTGWLLFNLGMGGEILLVSRSTLPESYKLIFDFSDNTCLAVNFWWVGQAHYVVNIDNHSMTANLGPNALGLKFAEFRELLRKRKGRIKSFLLNQRRIAGIGNVYVHDPLFKAQIHPLRSINTLTEKEIRELWTSIQETLQRSLDCGGANWETNLYGQNGKWDESHLLVAYREGKSCLRCGSEVEKIKVGSTASYICPVCQPID